MARGKQWRQRCPGCGRQIGIGFLAGAEAGVECPKSGATIVRRPDEQTLGVDR